MNKPNATGANHGDIAQYFQRRYIKERALAPEVCQNPIIGKYSLKSSRKSSVTPSLRIVLAKTSVVLCSNGYRSNPRLVPAELLAPAVATAQFPVPAIAAAQLPVPAVATSKPC